MKQENVWRRLWAATCRPARRGGAATGVARTLLDFVYPRACICCDTRMDGQAGHLCWDCLAAIRMVTDPMCEICGDPAEGLIDGPYTCAWCRDRRPAFEMARSAARFRGPLRDALHALKYGRATWIVADLARMLEACVRVHYRRRLLDGVTYVPLHPTRERERTFNQSRLLAGALARRLRLPVFARLTRRTRPTISQTGLNARERRRNVVNAFEARDRDWTAGRRLLLVDDIMTTGATVAECSRVLVEAGAKVVHVATVARG